MTFDANYPNHPWEGISTKERDWYVPFLREVYLRETIYSKFVTTQFQLAGPGSPVTQKMTITSLVPPHANFDPIGLRQLWMQSSYIDTFAREITFQRYGNKVAYHEFDSLITYWKSNKGAGLRGIVNAGLGTLMAETLDMLARNAFLSAPYARYGGNTSASANFSSITNWADHKLTTELVDDIRLGMAERGVPFTVQPAAEYTTVQPICITTPGAIRDLINETSGTGSQNQFIDVMRYADPKRIIRGEVGTYRGVRFIETPRAILYNCGPITHQAEIAAPASAGDGSPATKVDGVRIVGQPAATKYITVDDVGAFAVNDIVTIHTDRTSNFGVTNGVDYRDGTAQNRRIVAIDAANDRISLDYPILTEFTTDLGGGVYGYVTKGRHIHTSAFIGGMDGVVLGVGQAPRLHTPPAVDDFESMYRFSWEGYLGYQLFEPEVFELVYTAGSNRIIGARQN